jgi:hypothetical protein
LRAHPRNLGLAIRPYLLNVPLLPNSTNPLIFGPLGDILDQNIKIRKPNCLIASKEKVIVVWKEVQTSHNMPLK